MNNLNKIILSLLAVSAMTYAVPISGTSLQDALDDITVGGNSSIDVQTDQLTLDEYWQLTASGGSVNTLLVEMTSYANINTFGIYDANDPSNKVEIFSGAENGEFQAPNEYAAAQHTVSMLANGMVRIDGVIQAQFSSASFGYYLSSTAQFGYEVTYYSDASLNEGNTDHMVAFQGTGDVVQMPGYYPGAWTPNEYVLAFEDLWMGGDNDYSDLVVMVESVEPVPEPTTLGLIGLGLVGLGLRKRIRKS